MANFNGGYLKPSPNVKNSNTLKEEIFYKASFELLECVDDYKFINCMVRYNPLKKELKFNWYYSYRPHMMPMDKYPFLNEVVINSAQAHSLLFVLEKILEKE